MSHSVDLHNHVIPGVDDGAPDPAAAVAAVDALTAEGVSRIVATPHLDGSLTADPEALARRLAEIDAGWSELQAVVSGRADVQLHRGAEVKLDAPEVDLSEPRIRLGGGTAVLVEFAFMTVPPRSEQVLSRIRRNGFVPLVAHAERYVGLDAELNVIRSWLDAGAFLQVNAGSLLGRYGKEREAVASDLLSRGWATCLASDFHARGEPRLAAARALLDERGGTEQATLLFETNPARLLAGEEPVAVPPFAATAAFRQAIRRLLPW